MPPIRSTKSIPTEDQPALDAMELDQPSVVRNVTVHGRRTCLRLRLCEWDALNDIAKRERRTLSEIAGVIDFRRGDASLAAALRLFAIAYFKALGLPRDEGTEAPPPPAQVLRPPASSAGA